MSAAWLLRVSSEKIILTPRREDKLLYYLFLTLLMKLLISLTSLGETGSVGSL